MMAKCQVNYVSIVMAIMYIVRPAVAPASQREMEHKHQLICAKRPFSSQNHLDSDYQLYIICLTQMKQPDASKPNRTADAKVEALRRHSALHPNPNLVHDEAFRQNTPPESGGCMPVLRPDLTTLLANMVLNCLGREEAHGQLQ